MTNNVLNTLFYFGCLFFFIGFFALLLFIDHCFVSLVYSHFMALFLGVNAVYYLLTGYGLIFRKKWGLYGFRLWARINFLIPGHKTLMEFLERNKDIDDYFD